MKPLTEMAASELVAELAKRSVPPSVTMENIDHWFIKSGTAEAKIADNLAVWQMGLNEVTAELERRCEKFGLSLTPVGNVFIKTGDVNYAWAAFDESGLCEGVFIRNHSTAEFHALVGYLIAKGGGK